jgi:hypothetical protein
MTNIPINFNGNFFKGSKIIHYNNGNTVFFIITNNDNEEVNVDFFINDVKMETIDKIKTGQIINCCYPINQFQGRKIKLCSNKEVGGTSWVCPNKGRVVVKLNLGWKLYENPQKRHNIVALPHEEHRDTNRIERGVGENDVGENDVGENALLLSLRPGFF